ncbi:hypothetical protein [Zavarzinia sp. CC-PAN008]|uniref:hypothetical protein n=1 Tax=Zavarzinia sp. CC-PAN008 TaxID=3243332 RepID=UPI003F7472D5
MTRRFLPDLHPALRRRLTHLAIGGCVALALAQFGYAGLRGSQADQAVAEAARIRDDVAARQRAADAQPDGPDAGTQSGAATFLSRIERTASAASARITRLAPRTQDAGMYDVEVVADHVSLVRFVVGVEASGALIHSLGTGRASADGDLTATHLVLSPGSGQPLTGAHFQALRVRAEGAGVRDVAAQAGQAATDRLPVLPGAHRLTAVSSVGSVRWATIDDADYRVGQSVADAQVLEIHPDAVVLSDGRRRMVLRLSRGD